jgi:hypothetical protein
VNALLFDFAQFRQREDLEAAAVGQNGPVPVREGMQTARLLHDLHPWPYKEVVGVPEDDLRVQRLQLLRMHAFTVPCVPTGMKTGVSTTPCGVVSRPRRARDEESVARSSKDMGGPEKGRGVSPMRRKEQGLRRSCLTKNPQPHRTRTHAEK